MPPAKPIRGRPARGNDPLLREAKLSKEECLRLLEALQAGMGLSDTDALTPDVERRYRQAADELFMWATEARPSKLLIDKAIRGEVTVLWTPQDWRFQMIGDKAN